jgi:hypothetical protein
MTGILNYVESRVNVPVIQKSEARMKMKMYLLGFAKVALQMARNNGTAE